MDSLSFLQSVAGYTRAQTDGSADRPILLGIVDPAYDKTTFPLTLPKITFDGETVLSGKRYPVMSPYRPTAGDRVVLVPIGTTYLIVGALDNDASIYVGGETLGGGGAAQQAVDGTNRTTTSTGFTTTLTPANICGVSFVAPASGKVMLHYACDIQNSGAAWSVMSPGVLAGGTVGSGATVLAASFELGVRNDSSTLHRYGASHLLTGLTPGSVYNACLHHLVQSGTGTFARRSISVVPTP